MTAIRRPKLDARVMASLDALQQRFTPADCEDPILAPGLHYLIALRKHFDSPKAVGRRKQVLERAVKFRESKGKS